MVAAFPRGESQEGQAETVSSFVTWLQKSECVTYPRVAPSLEFGGGNIAPASLQDEGQSWLYKDQEFSRLEILCVANFGQCSSPQRRDGRPVSSVMSPALGNMQDVQTEPLTSQHGQLP